jgi:predicted alpha/beta hydrolase family esterase
MKRQVVLIHGGDPYDSYGQYIASLKKIKIDWKRMQVKGWKESLQAQLGPKFSVLAPRMPNSMNAKYLEWKIWFEKFIPYMNSEVIFVGHSLGGIFLPKYLSLNRFSKKIKGIFLVAPPFEGNGPRDPMADFILPKNMSRFAKYRAIVHLYHSTDDKIVQTSDFQRYLKVLPEAQVRIFKDRGHFTGQKFPEIVKDIKSLYK